MKNFLLILALVLSLPVFGKGKIQDQDVKSKAELVAAGATEASLINDTKIYVTGGSFNDQLSDMFTAAVGSGVLLRQTLPSLEISGAGAGKATISYPNTASNAAVVMPSVNTTMPTVLPVIAGQALKATTAGVQSYDTDFANDATVMRNLSVVSSVATSDLTFALKGADGNDPSATNPVVVSIRTGASTWANRTITSALSLTIQDGSTLGHISAKAHKLWIYVVDSNGSGAVKLAISTTKIVKEFQVITTVDGTGAGDLTDNNDIYSDDVYSNVYARCIGYADSTQTTAGTWAAAPTMRIGPEAAAYPDIIVAHYSNGAGTSFAYGTLVDFPAATIVRDSHNAFNTATFTAPEAGIYEINFYFSFSGITNDVGAYRITSSGCSPSDVYRPILREASNNMLHNYVFICPLAKGDTHKFQVNQSNVASDARSLVAGGAYNGIFIKKIGELP